MREFIISTARLLFSRHSALLLGVSVGLSCAAAFVYDVKWKEVGAARPQPVRPGTPTIQLGEVLIFQKMDRVTLVDARPLKTYSVGHIDKAVSVPGDQPLDAIEHQLKAIVREGNVLVIYCGTAGCDLAKSMVDRLVVRGWTNIFLYSGGFEEWAGAGLPTSSTP